MRVKIGWSKSEWETYNIALLYLCWTQWRNSRGRVPPPRHLSPGNFCWPNGKREEGNKKKIGKSKKGRWKIENGRRKSYKIKMRRGLFFLFFFFSFHFSSLFKTTEICFGSTKVGIQEKWLCLLWKIFLLRPWLNSWLEKLGNQVVGPTLLDHCLHDTVKHMNLLTVV